MSTQRSTAGADGATVAEVTSVNVGEVRTVDWAGRQVQTGIWKAPTTGRVPVEGVNLRGDDQADRRVHGGPDMAVYAYADEDYEWWSGQLGEDLGPGTFGENLTTIGVDLQPSVIGERWEVGTTVLDVSQPRLPCFKLGIRMGDAGFVDMFDAARRYGTYLRIVSEGDIGAGDPITLLSRPDHGLTVADIATAYHDPSADLLERLVSVEQVPEGWSAWARRKLDRLATRGPETSS